MKKLLIVIDYQNDFVADDGALTCGKMAQDIEDNLVKAIDRHLEKHDYILFTQDTHYKKTWNSHLESNLFPIHCVQGTPGHDLYGKLNNKFPKVYKKSYVMDKQHIENIVAFCDEIELAGVATNICVLQNAIALYNEAVYQQKKIKFIIKSENCASFDEHKHWDALNYMQEVLGFVLD